MRETEFLKESMTNYSMLKMGKNKRFEEKIIC